MLETILKYDTRLGKQIVNKHFSKILPSPNYG